MIQKHRPSFMGVPLHKTSTMTYCTSALSFELNNEKKIDANKKDAHLNQIRTKYQINFEKLFRQIGSIQNEIFHFLPFTSNFDGIMHL